jgi:uncharacterized protein YndB with AHSA1/START domain
VRRRHQRSPVVFEAEVDINRPPEEVFDYCSDHHHEPEWNPMMTHIAKLTGGPIGAGTRYAAEFVKGPGHGHGVHPVPAPGRLVFDR